MKPTEHPTKDFNEQQGLLDLLNSLSYLLLEALGLVDSESDDKSKPDNVDEGITQCQPLRIASMLR